MTAKHTDSLVRWLTQELINKWNRERAPEPPVSAGQMTELDRTRQFVSPLGGTAVEQR